jgi:DNA-binding transcriptional MocR family regulator
MVPVALTGQGPDMAEVERLVVDPSVKGIWCVPKYSNPTGEVYSDETVERLAAMEAAAPDFRIFWDNAYAVHRLTEETAELANMLEACARHGHPNRALVFGSTSKITYGGGGLSLFASSPENVRWMVERAGKRTIGPDKLNQLRHVRLLRDMAGVEALMEGHRRILAPKFRAVQDTFAAELAGIATWTEPKGGYFVSLDVPDGCARRVVELARAAGVALTPAGSTFPYGRDPRDRNIRIAPTFPRLEDVRAAAEAVAVCVQLASVESAIERQPAAV